MYQNKDMLPESIKNTYKMDNKKKQELSKANFKFGNSIQDFRTVSQNDFELKSPVNNSNANVDSKKIGNALRSHSYVMGDFTNDYLSDNKIRFLNPNVKKRNK